MSKVPNDETKNESTGRWNKSNSGCGIRIGEREKYHDFSF